MAEVTATNSTSPNTIKWATAGSDRFVRATHLAGVTENYDGHDHSSGKCLGVKRAQTTAAPAAAGELRVSTDDFQWWGSSAAAVQTAVRLAGTQTITGAKTFSSILYVNDTSNAFQTFGLTINQGAATDEMIALKLGSLTHGMTTLTETDTNAALGRIVGGSGGLGVHGYSSGTIGVLLQGLHTSDDTTKSNAAIATVVLDGLLKSGTTAGAVGANANLLAVRNAGTTRFILDADGDSHQDVGTAWTNFDEYDDPALLTALAVGVSRDGDPIKERFGRFLDEQRAALERSRLVTFDDDGHHFVNFSRLTMALVGAVRQQAARVDALERRLALAEGT